MSPASLAAACPAGNNPMRSRSSRRAASCSSPPAARMAPSTPPPPISPLLAAFTTASTSWSTMSPRTTTICIPSACQPRRCRPSVRRKQRPGLGLAQLPDGPDSRLRETASDPLLAAVVEEAHDEEEKERQGSAGDGQECQRQNAEDQPPQEQALVRLEDLEDVLRVDVLAVRRVVEHGDGEASGTV